MICAGKSSRVRKLHSITMPSIAGLFVAVCAASAYGQLAVPDDGQQAVPQLTFHGVAVNRVTGKPIARALVFTPDNRYATLTDQEGRFEVKLPVNLQQGLMVRKPGFLQDASSQAQSGDGDMKLTLTPEAIVAGRVNLSTSDSAAGVQVELLRKEIQNGRSRWFAAGVAMTNSRGEFRFADLTAGNYKLMTREWVDRDPVSEGKDQQHYGYPPVYYPDAADYGSAGILHAEAGQVAQADFSLTRQPYYSVEIPVANAIPGQPLSVTVNAATAKAQVGPAGFDLGYNPRRQRIEGELPNGSYTVEVSNNRPDGSSGTVTVTVGGAPATGAPITIVRNQSIDVVVKEELTATPQSETENAGGTITFVSQRPNQRLVSVVLMPEDEGRGGGAGLRQPPVAGDPSLLIENVSPGRYLVQAFTNSSYVASITSGITDLRREPLVVGGSGVAAPIEITLRNDYATLEGTIQLDVVKDRNTTAFGFTPGAYLYCIPTSDRGEYTEGIASPDGKFTITNLVPGTYRVLAFDQRQQLEYANPEVMRAYEAQGNVVTVNGGQTLQVELTKLAASLSAGEQ